MSIRGNYAPEEEVNTCMNTIGPRAPESTPLSEIVTDLDGLLNGIEVRLESVERTLYRAGLSGDFTDSKAESPKSPGQPNEPELYSKAQTALRTAKRAVDLLNAIEVCLARELLS